MNIRSIIIVLFIFWFISVDAQHVLVNSKYDIMHVVTSGNSKLNSIYRKIVLGSEEKHKDLRTAIYNANSSLIDIRSILVPFDAKVTDKTVKAIQGNLDSLATLLDEVDEKQEKAELIEKINKIGEEAGAVLNGLKKKK